MAQDLPPDEQDPPNALPRGTLLNDKFRVRRVIGVGGFGIVYLAHDEMSDVDVAIKEYMPASLAGRTKTMHVSLSSQSNADTFALGLKSFWNEARLLAKFRDEHLPLLKVYDAFQANGTAYMVMPVLRGRTAHQIRRDMAKPPNERWLRTLLSDLLPALERLHAENVYHRDIAPDNIQIDANGKPVLMDLGAARHVISNRTQSITAILKPGYAPIEQYGESDKLRQGPWTDIYALGATLHFLLLNKSPASATARIFDTGTPLVAHDLPDCSPAFLRVIDWMLEPKPEARPQSVEQLRTALFDSDDATVVMAPKRTPRPESRTATPTAPTAPAPPPPAPAAQPLTMPATVAATQVQARPLPATLAALPPTVAAGPAASAAALRTAPPLSAPGPSQAASITSHSANERSRMPVLLAGAAALVLVAGAAVWLWPGASTPAATSARTNPASAPQPEPPTPPRLEPAAVPTAATAPVTPAATPSPPPIVAEPAPAPAAFTAAPPPTPPPAAATTPVTPPDNEATRAAAAAPNAPNARKAAVPPPVVTAAPAAPPARKTPLNDKDGALLPKPADANTQAAAAPAPTPAPVPAPAPPASAAPAPATAAPAPAANAVVSPTQRCADQGGSIARRLCVAVVCGLPELHNHPECLAVRGK